jgi:gluconolactonase
VTTQIPRPRSGHGHAARFVAHDRAFRAVVGDSPRLLRVVETGAHEGPVYVAGDDALYFTTVPRLDERGVPRVAIRRLELDGLRFPLDPEWISTVREPANVANGMTLNQAGFLIVCEQGTFDTPARISRVDRVTGAAETVVEGRGARFNSPNDVVVRSDGTIWFTDPSYGHLQGFRPEPEAGDLVYRYDPAADELSVAADGFDKPNGLAFAPDERALYVADNGEPHHLLAFDVSDDGRRLAGRRVLAVGTPDHPDGLKVDADGNLYASARHGIQVFAPDGSLAGEIHLPGAVNFTFGGPGRNVLFITADAAIWAAVLNAKGA